MSQRLFSTLAEWLAAESVVLASVLATRGASPRHGGAQMLVTESRIDGSVGGGRLELHTIAAARALLSSGRDNAAVAIDLTGRDGAHGVCGGSMQIALRRCQGAADRIRAIAIADSLAAGRRVILDADTLGADATLTLEPAPRLLILGAGHCGLALCRAALPLGYDLHVLDDRSDGYDPSAWVGATCHRERAALPALLDSERRIAAVLQNRDWRSDVALLPLLAARPPLYIGMMGSRKRIRQVFKALPELGDLCARIHAPVGLPIGAETPEELAISVLAQVIAAFSAQLRGTGT
ncbi:MAG: XdhC family protein [Xanthomonadales bacterium]|nr:XdhC family protein [Xanthomonadales bacterium]